MGTFWVIYGWLTGTLQVDSRWVIGILQVGYRWITGTSEVSYGYLMGRWLVMDILPAVYRQVTSNLWAGYEQVTGTLQVGYRWFTGTLWVGHGHLTGGLWVDYGHLLGSYTSVGHIHFTGDIANSDVIFVWCEHALSLYQSRIERRCFIQEYITKIGVVFVPKNSIQALIPAPTIVCVPLAIYCHA